MNSVEFFKRLDELSIKQPYKQVIVSVHLTLFWGELLSAIEDRVQWLMTNKVTRLGLLSDNSVNWILWDLAAIKVGIILVPMPLFFSQDQHRHLIMHASLDCILTDIESESENVSSVVKNNVQFGTTELINCHYTFYRFKCEKSSIDTAPKGTSKITFTSGSTGEPKGVCLSDKQQLTVAWSLVNATQTMGISCHDCLLPLATLLENIAGVYAPLLAGAAISVMPMAVVGFKSSTDIDVAKFVSGLVVRKSESIVLLPQLLLALVSCIEMGAKKPEALKFIAVGGGRVSEDLLVRAEIIGLPVYQGYGLSENASVSTLNLPGNNKLLSVGKPLQHNEICISKSNEVMIKGNQMLGYLGEQKPSSEWLATGDLGYLDDDGFLYIKGRQKNQFITSFGRNVNPEWVESELTQQLTIQQAIVWGEGKPFNIAIIVKRTSFIRPKNIQFALDMVNEKLPNYAKVTYWIDAIEKFSLVNGFATANGRLKREAILAHYEKKINAAYEGHGYCHENKFLENL